ncbi:MAG: hypothetical protein QMB82_09235, partial [Bacteroidales bacterium]
CTLCGRLSFCFAQNVFDPELILQGRIENMEEGAGEDLLEDLLENPLKINEASLLRLEEFPLFTRFMAASLYDYIKRNGAILSSYELSAVPGFNKEVAEALAPFLDLSAERGIRIRELPVILKGGRSQLLMRGSAFTKRQQGYLPISAEEWKRRPNSRYHGPPGRVYAQYKFEVPGAIRLSLTTEKDPGERIGDYVGLSLQAEGLGPVVKIIAGDFTARFGQGLVLWNSPSLFSSSGSSSLIKQEFGISSYSSTDENRAFRGVGITTGKGKINISLIASSRRIDARIVNEGFTSLLNTGLHNTVTTRERRKNLNLSLSGLNISYGAERIRTGLTLSLYRYSFPYAGRDSVQIDRQRRFGNFGGNLGTDIYAIAGNFRLFGEISSDIGLHPAILAGILWRRGYNLDFSVAGRYYSALHLSPFGGAISRSGNMRNEKGADFVINWRSNGSSKIRGWVSWIYGMSFPRVGAEAEFPLDNSFKIKIKSDIREERGAVRLQVDWTNGGTITLSTRGEATLAGFGKDLTSGWMVYSELIAREPSGVADGSARISFFNTPEWDNRVYAYERDMLYGFSIPALYGQGFRCYINMHFRVFKWMDIWLKGSMWHYLDRESTGEGPSKMEGPSSVEIKGEVRFRF